MESACQVKGCKVNNKKASKHVPDDTRALAKDNNNVNCSDDEETSKCIAKKNVKNSSVISSTPPPANESTCSSNNNNNNNNNVIQSSRGSSSGSNESAKSSSSSTLKAPSTEAIPYNKVVSSSSKSTMTSSDLPYNKVVSNGKAATSDLTYTQVVSNGRPSTTSLTYNKVVSNNYCKLTAKPASDAGDAGPKPTESGSTPAATKALPQETLVSIVDDKSASREAVHAPEKSPSKKKSSDPEAQQRRAVLTYEQVCRLNDVMNEVVCIHGRGNFPTLEVRLRDLMNVVMDKLEVDPSNGGAGMKVRDIRLNGGAASHVLATESQPYNDLDLIFGVELSSARNYDKVKSAVLCSLFDLLPAGVSRKRITTCSLKEAYVSKMVKVNNDGDRWSLISLGNSRGHRNVELKFVDTMRRQFEFSVDSFQIVLDPLLEFNDCSGTVQFSESCYPSVVGESVYGDFHEALYHLQKKLISTRHPEEIRGGGLLKYCNLLVKMYKPAQPDYIKTLERYMCSRFFIDFPDIGQQKAKLENYLWNHFVGPGEEALKYQYLMLLHSVVEESTVCLMGHERRQTLALIESLAYQVLCQEQQRLTNHQAPPAAYVYANGYYYAPVIPTACYTCTCNSWMACSS